MHTSAKLSSKRKWEAKVLAYGLTAGGRAGIWAQAIWLPSLCLSVLWYMNYQVPSSLYTHILFLRLAELPFVLEDSLSSRDPLKCLSQFLKDLMCLLLARAHNHPHANILLGLRETIYCCLRCVLCSRDLIYLSFSLLQKVTSSLLRRPFLSKQETLFLRTPNTTYMHSLGFLFSALSLL